MSSIEKTFCIMEQGKFINEPLTLKHKEQFNTSFSDFYRLNWFTDTDPNANFHAKGITLSEGKNLLYQKVPKIYKYYIFIDDDINFTSTDNTPTDNTPIAEKIKNILDTYNPLHGTFYRKIGAKWGAWHVTNIIHKHASEKREVWPVFGFDLDCDIYHWSYIRSILPIRYHGCYKCLTYAQYICYKLYPHKQLMFDGIRLENTRQGNHMEELSLSQANNGNEVTRLFLKDLVPNSLNKDARIILNNTHMVPDLNLRLYSGNVSNDEIIFTTEDMKKICTW